MLLESMGILISENDEVGMSSRKYEGHAPPGSSTYWNLSESWCELIRVDRIFRTLAWSSRWWFQIFFLCSSLIGEMIQFDEHIFQLGWNHRLVLYDQMSPNEPNPLNFVGNLSFKLMMQIYCTKVWCHCGTPRKYLMPDLEHEILEKCRQKEWISEVDE